MAFRDRAPAEMTVSGGFDARGVVRRLHDRPTDLHTVCQCRVADSVKPANPGDLRLPGGQARAARCRSPVIYLPVLDEMRYHALVLLVFVPGEFALQLSSALAAGQAHKLPAMHRAAPTLSVLRRSTLPRPMRTVPSTLPRTTPTMSLALPTCTAAGVWTLAAKAGCTGLLAQLGLFTLFKNSGDPILSKAPGYSAHSAIALALMVFCVAFGLAGWLSPPAAAATEAGRLLMPSNSARWLGAMLLGMLLIWDIPTCLRIQRLRKADMLGHHVAMAMTAFVGSTMLPTHYGLYYMGVVELSSVPLTAYDQCDMAYEVGSKMDEVKPQKLQTLRSKRDLFRSIAAVCFILVRAIDFTRVTLSKFVPDALAMLRSPTTAANFVLPLKFMIVSSVGFVGLQLYWFSMFARISLAQRAREKKRAAKKKEKADSASGMSAMGFPEKDATV